MRFLSKVWIGDRVQWLPETAIETASATYRILYALGEGGVGSVYAADIVDIKLESIDGFEMRGLGIGSMVAIKQQTLSDQQTWNEASILSALSGFPESCDIASCLIDFSIRQATDTAILVIQLLSGAQDGLAVTELLQRLERIPAARQLRLDLLSKFFAAVGTMHELGFYHRDLKPENLVVGENESINSQEMIETWFEVIGQPIDVQFEPSMTNLERYVALRESTPSNLDVDPVLESDFVSIVSETLVVKLIDFGLSTRNSQSRIIDGYAETVGTPRYVDPWLVACGGDIAFYGPPAKREQALNEFDIWLLTDVWSAGVTAYTMFWGEYLFPDTQPDPPDFKSKTLLNSREKTLLTHALSSLQPKFDEDELLHEELRPQAGGRGVRARTGRRHEHRR